MSTPSRPQPAPLLRATLARLRGHDLLLLAAGVTFFAAVAVVPLAVVCARLAALVGGDAVVRRTERVVVAVVPRDAGAASGARALADAALHAPLAVLASSVVPATLYGEGVRRALGTLAGTVDDTAVRRAVRGRLLALAGFGIVPAGLVLVAFAGATVAGAATSAPAARALGAYLSFLLMWGLATVALAATYRLGTPRRPRPAALLWGAAGTGSFVAGMTVGLLQLLQAPVDLGRAYGGFRSAGLLALAGGWLWSLHAVVLVGFAVTRALDEDPRCWRPFHRPGRGGARAPFGGPGPDQTSAQPVMPDRAPSPPDPGSPEAG